jgi:hypothetical protein
MIDRHSSVLQIKPLADTLTVTQWQPPLLSLDWRSRHSVIRRCMYLSQLQCSQPVEVLDRLTLAHLKQKLDPLSAGLGSSMEQVDEIISQNVIREHED